MVDAAAIRGLHRFGLGLRPGDLPRAGEARDAMLAEANARHAPTVISGDLPTSRQAAAELFDFQETQRADRARGAPPSTPATATPEMGGPNLATPMARAGDARTPPAPQRLFRAEGAARFAAAMQPAFGFGERLAQFWSNHFCVSVAKSQLLRGLAGPFEREAIRPHVFGRFEDMLVAVETHPAMLAFLDNQQSIGPNSRGGQRRGRGLNENLAREILELHTLGVDGGYSQADVTALAAMITGWTFVGRRGRQGEPGDFLFNANLHEPGAHTLLGRAYADDGFAQGRRALGDLARHPATARHVATKLARWFVADEPPAKLVAALAETFRKTGGDLAAVSAALISSNEAWSAPATKLRTPFEFVVAAWRALGRQPDFGPMERALLAMGQPLWRPPGPNGFTSDARMLAAPDALRARIDFAAVWARQAGGGVDPRALVETALGPLASLQTRQAAGRAESRPEAIALLLMSPEFQRR